MVRAEGLLGLLQKALGIVTQHTDNTGRRHYLHRIFQIQLGGYEIKLFFNSHNTLRSENHEQIKL